MGRGAKRAGSRCQIVNHDSRAPLHIPHERQRLHLFRGEPLFGHYRKIAFQHLRIGIGGLYSAGVRRHHDRIGQIPLAQALYDHRRRIEVVNRNIEEPLYLLGMQIHREHPVRAGSLEKIGNQLCRDRNARLILPVLPRIPVIRNNRRDPGSGGAFHGIHHHQKLHDVFVRWPAERLDDEYVAAPDVFLDFYKYLAIGKAADLRLAQRLAEISSNLPRKRQIGIARKNLHLSSTGPELVARPGFEPGLRPPKGRVLPLHHRAEFCSPGATTDGPSSSPRNPPDSGHDARYGPVQRRFRRSR